MYLDTSWRNGVQAKLLERAQEDSMTTAEKVKELVDIQFNDFAEPIKHLTEISQINNIHRYKAYDRALDVEYSGDKIEFYRVMFSANGEEVEKTYISELVHYGGIYVHIPIGGSGQREKYVNQSYIEEILKDCFVVGIDLRM